MDILILNLHPGERVLELACGNGVFARRMAQLGVQVLATDFSASLLELARSRQYADRMHGELLSGLEREAASINLNQHNLNLVY